MTECYKHYSLPMLILENQWFPTFSVLKIYSRIPLEHEGRSGKL